jgi:hypothetical protein
MARMSIDDMVARDPRITVLAKLIGWSRRETLGCLVGDVWPITYDQRTHLISERVIDAAAGLDGFAKAMVEAELATRDRSGKVRIGGAKERIKYLDKKTRAGREGGLKSAESRRKASKQTSSSGGSTPQAAGNPPVPDPSPVPVPDPSPVPVPEEGDSPPARAPSLQLELVKGKVDAVAKAAKAPTEHQRAVAAFNAYYQRAHGGAKPTWGAKTGKLMSTLVKAHGVDEIERRIGILEANPPSFPKPPWDMPTLAQHFDKVASAATSNRSVALGRVEPHQPHEYPDGEVEF